MSSITNEFRIGIDANRLPQLEQLNNELFPVKYSRRFYAQLLRPPSIVLCCWRGDELIANLCARIVEDDFWFFGREVSVYIMTLGVHASARRTGIASRLLTLLEQHIELHVPNCEYISLHVKVSVIRISSRT